MAHSIKNQFQNDIASAKFAQEEDFMCEGFDDVVTADDIEQAYQDYIPVANDI